LVRLQRFEDAGVVCVVFDARRARVRHTEAEIKAKIEAKGSSIDQFRSLFLAIAAEEAMVP
jgi:hypothetical protein